MEIKRKWILLAINLVVFAVILYWLREQITLSELLAHFKSLPTEALVGALALNIAVICVYGLRLSVLLSAQQHHALAIVIIGFGMNGVLPFRLGEVAKLVYAKQLFGISTSRMVAATTAEKLLDLFALLLLGLVASKLVVAPYLSHGISIAGAFVGIIIMGLAVAFVVQYLWESAGRKTHKWIAEAFDTLRAQRGLSRIIRLTLLTALIWMFTVASVYWWFSSVFMPFSLIDACVLTLVLALAIAIPSTSAGLGIVEAAIVAYLHQAFETESSLALASALAFHFAIVIPQVLATAGILINSFVVRRMTRP
jgi:uncharacterized membrane protein YbhN (UPF0104 family)